jgi:hypothetical protein
MLKFVFILIFCLTFNSSFSQVEEGRRITKELCSEKYFGRGYIKSGDSLAAEFLASEFEKRGLKKIKKSWFQEFNFTVNTFPANMEVKFNDKFLITGKDYIVDPSSGSSNMNWNYKLLTNSELFDEKKLFEIVAEIQLKKIINGLIVDTRLLKGDSLKKVKSIQFQLAQICAVISVTDEKFTFSVSDEQFPFALIYVKGEKFLENGNKIQTNIDAKLIKNHHSRNVFAYLPAKNRTKKTLLLTAHYDHLGGMGDNTYFPGGNDNASGTSMLFALADEFKKNPLKYNVVFIAFAGEEAGLLGSKHFVENPLVKLKNIKFVQNLDIMGSGEEGITVVNATIFPDIFEKLNSINEREKLLSQIKKRGKAANSDHYWFTEYGIPAFFIYTMGPNKNYHDVFDTYEDLSFNEYNDLVKLIGEFLRTF